MVDIPCGDWKWMSKVDLNQKVTLYYTLRNSQGKILEEIPTNEAITYVHGYNQIFPNLEKGLQGLLTAMKDTHFVGGNAVLLVPGAARDPEKESHGHVWTRSIEQIKKALPTASKLGVRILIENVWNNFLYDPKGDNDQSASLLAAYLDEINSPWVGSYFDIGNHQRFGKPAEWIRTLGHRIVKLDVKDWGVDNGFCKIGEGDVDWADVRSALHQIGYTGWATAEVSGGDRHRIKDISERMDQYLLGK